MSLYGALFSGVSGLAAQSSAMGAISDNITNVNTIGYKGTKVQFKTLVTKQVSSTQYSPGGVQAAPRSGVDIQGLLQASSSSTDIALSGQGFFVVNTNADPATSGAGLFGYTRAGSFQVDSDGYMTNTSGFYLQGWPLAATDGSADATPTHVDVNGNTYMKAYKNADGTWHYINQNIIDENEMKPLNLKTIGGTADQTSQIKLGANLPAGDSIYDPSVLNGSGLHETSILVYDSLGDTHSFNVPWMKTNPNTWNIQQKTDLYSLQNTLTTLATSTTPDITVTGGPAGSTTTVITNGRITGSADTQGVAFFDDGTIAFADTDTAEVLPVGTVFTVDDVTGNTNEDTYMVKTNGTQGALTVNADDDTATIYVAGTTAAVFTGGNLNFASATTIDFTGTTAGTNPASIAVGAMIKIAGAEDSGNNGYYYVTAVAAGVATVSPASYVQIQTDQYLTRRGVQPPAGAATMTMYDTTGSGNAVYASQGRLDFTAGSRADVLAMDGLTFTMTMNSVDVVVEFTSDGSIAAGSDIAIDLSSTSIDTGAEVASLVAQALRNPRNFLTANGGNTMNSNLAADAIAFGDTLPLYSSDGATVFICQQVGGTEIQFNVSGLSTACTQSQTRVWSAGPPPTDSATGTFTLAEITQTDNAIEFNGDGTPQDINITTLGIDWANGAQSMAKVSSDIDKRMSLFMGNTSQADGMTQLGGSYQLAYLSQNGAQFGNYTGVSVDEAGVVTALFDNGVRRPIFQIPVSTFTNANGLESLTGNTWIETDESGSYTLRTAGDAGSGKVQGASLEASTVDIGTEFTTMITTQRAYSAAAKIITTADEMLDELVRIKR